MVVFGRIGLPVAEAYFNRVIYHLASFTELFVSKSRGCLGNSNGVCNTDLPWLVSISIDNVPVVMVIGVWVFVIFG